MATLLINTTWFRFIRIISIPRPGTSTKDLAVFTLLRVVATPASLIRARRLLPKSAITEPVPLPVLVGLPVAEIVDDLVAVEVGDPREEPDPEPVAVHD